MTETILWNKCLQALSPKLSDKQMRTWLHPLVVTQKNNILKVIAPNKFIMDEIETEYMCMI